MIFQACPIEYNRCDKSENNKSRFFNFLFKRVILDFGQRVKIASILLTRLSEVPLPFYSWQFFCRGIQKDLICRFIDADHSAPLIVSDNPLKIFIF